jgi:(2Fe-2S) ferredoxin
MASGLDATAARADIPSQRRSKAMDCAVSVREHYLFVCNNLRPPEAPRPSCQGSGSAAIFAELKKQIAAAGLAQSVARCCQTSCLDCCDDGPVVLVEPEHWMYTHVRAEDVPDIVESIRTGSPVRRLLASVP